MTWSKLGKMVLTTFIIGTAVIATFAAIVGLVIAACYLVTTGWGILVLVVVVLYAWIGYHVPELVNDAEKHGRSIWKEFWYDYEEDSN